MAIVDLCWTGGLTEGRKIAALAETWHRPFATHDCIGPVGFAAAVHASFKSLSEVARAITGTRWNGPRFFGLRETP